MPTTVSQTTTPYATTKETGSTLSPCWWSDPVPRDGAIMSLQTALEGFVHVLFHVAALLPPSP